MRIVLVHNFYQQAGGEDRVFADEAELLSAHRHDVITFTRHNDDVNGLNRLQLAVGTVWNRKAARDLERVVREHRAEVVHFHNTLPLLSPATYYAARRAGAAVVQTLHNYRLACPKATLFRDGRACELCLDKIIPWPAIRHACYRDNRSASAAIVAMLAFHRAIGTYRRAIDAYIALSHFSRDKLVEAGLPIERMHLRPNYMLHDPGEGPGGGGYAFYLGRLSPEKGVDTLLRAWLDYDPGLPLVICGNGPMAPAVERRAARCERIKWYPNQSDEEVLRRMGEASVFVLPSTNYEGFPKTIVEAYAKGTPVVASRLGAMAELVRQGISGSCFMPGDAADLAFTIRRTTANAEELMRMRRATRRLFETEYAALANYSRLLEIYDQALRVRHGAALSTRVTTADAPLESETRAFKHESTVEVIRPEQMHDVEVCA
jgi:glycosyltransferase involved in cell wall biosynthesis